MVVVSVSVSVCWAVMMWWLQWSSTSLTLVITGPLPVCVAVRLCCCTNLMLSTHTASVDIVLVGEVCATCDAIAAILCVMAAVMETCTRACEGSRSLV